MLSGLGPVDGHYSFNEIYNLNVGKRKSLSVYQYDLDSRFYAELIILKFEKNFS